MAPRRTRETVAQFVDDCHIKLGVMDLDFDTDRNVLIEQIFNFKKSPMMFTTLFKKFATDTEPEYHHPKPVKIHHVLTGHTQIPPHTKRTRDYVIECLHDWDSKLAAMGVAFVESHENLIEQILKFDKPPSQFPTLFKKLKTDTEDEYIHPHPVPICWVINKQMIIQSDADKKRRREEVVATHFPRGVDLSGDKETARFHALLQLFPQIKELFDIEETTRGSLTDIILTSKTDGRIVFGLQLATAKMTMRLFNFNKTVEQIVTCLDNNLVVLLIAMVEDQIAGVYMIPPTEDIKNKLAEFGGSTILNPTLCNKYERNTETLNSYLETFRYIRESFAKGVKGTIKGLDTFPTDFLKLCDDYPLIITTAKHLSSLFPDPTRRTEWVCDMSFETNVADILNITQKRIHGERGDMQLDFDGEFQVIDERKTLGVKRRSKKSNANNSKSWELGLRGLGKQGLNPSKVRVTTGFIRSDRSQRCPNQPEQIIGFVLLCVITAAGNLALRPDKPESLHLNMSCDTANRSEWVEFVADKIGANMYPDQETFVSGETTKTRMRAAFYYDELKNPDGKRLAELRKLYKTFANRTPTADAIQHYETAVSDELIDNEKRQMAIS